MSRLEDRAAVPGKQARNYGIDLLRIVAMWLICCQHIINRGGVYAATGESRQLLYPLWVLATVGVNLYALISGYVTVKGRFHPARAAELWLQVFVLDLVLSTAGELYNPDWMDPDMWRRNLMPLTQKAYWYFTAYMGVYALSPLINRGLLALNRRQSAAMFWLMLLLFSVGTTLGYAWQGDPYSIGSGYSVLWLLALYVMGACMRHGKLLEKTPWWVLLLGAVLCVLLLTHFHDLMNQKDVSQFWKDQRKQLLRYTNPFMTGLAVFLVALFAKIRLRGFAVWPVKLLSPLTFGVYVIHVQHVGWSRMEGAYKPLLELKPGVLPWAVLAAGLGLFLACAVLDWLRLQLFRLLRVRRGLDALERRLLGRLNQTKPESGCER